MLTLPWNKPTFAVELLLLCFSSPSSAKARLQWGREKCAGECLHRLPGRPLLFRTDKWVHRKMGTRWQRLWVIKPKADCEVTLTAATVASQTVKDTLNCRLSGENQKWYPHYYRLQTNCCSGEKACSHWSVVWKQQAAQNSWKWESLHDILWHNNTFPAS